MIKALHFTQFLNFKLIFVSILNNDLRVLLFNIQLPLFILKRLQKSTLKIVPNVTLTSVTNFTFFASFDSNLVYCSKVA